MFQQQPSAPLLKVELPPQSAEVEVSPLTATEQRIISLGDLFSEEGDSSFATTVRKLPGTLH